MVKREIGGVVYVCTQMPAEPGFALFLRVSSTLASAEGLFAAIATSEDNRGLIGEFFQFARSMDPEAVHKLVLDLASACKRESDGGAPEPKDVQELLELAFFCLGVNFGNFFPVLPDTLFTREVGVVAEGEA